MARYGLFSYIFHQITLLWELSGWECWELSDAKGAAWGTLIQPLYAPEQVFPLPGSLLKMFIISSMKFYILFPRHLILSHRCYSRGYFGSGQCHVQSRLDKVFHWCQELNLVQRCLYNLRSHLSSPPSVAPSVPRAAWPVPAIAQQKANEEGFGFLGLPTEWFLKHQ